MSAGFTATHIDSGDAISWAGGRFSGAERLVGEALVLCAGQERIDVGPTLAIVRADAADPLAAWAVMHAVCRGRLRFTGDVPDVSALAVAGDVLVDDDQVGDPLVCAVVSAAAEILDQLPLEACRLPGDEGSYRRGSLSRDATIVDAGHRADSPTVLRLTSGPGRTFVVLSSGEFGWEQEGGQPLAPAETAEIEDLFVQLQDELDVLGSDGASPGPAVP